MSCLFSHRIIFVHSFIIFIFYFLFFVILFVATSSSSFPSTSFILSIFDMYMEFWAYLLLQSVCVFFLLLSVIILREFTIFPNPERFSGYLNLNLLSLFFFVLLLLLFYSLNRISLFYLNRSAKGWVCLFSTFFVVKKHIKMNRNNGKMVQVADEHNTTYWFVSSWTISCWPHIESIGSTIPCLHFVWKLHTYINIRINKSTERKQNHIHEKLSLWEDKKKKKNKNK